MHTDRMADACCIDRMAYACCMDACVYMSPSPLKFCPKYVPCPTHATYPTYASTAIMAAVLSLGAMTVVAKSYDLALGCCVKRAGDGGSKTVFLAPPAQSCPPGADVVYDLTPAAPTRVDAAVRHVSKGSGDEEPPSKKNHSPLPMKTHMDIPTGINNQQKLKSQCQTSSLCVWHVY
jgi:hypothetical protein